jgi:hypothetical protein
LGTTGHVGEVDSRQVPRGRVGVVVAVWVTTALGLAGCRVGIIINNWPIRMALRYDEGQPVEQGMVCVVEARDAVHSGDALPRRTATTIGHVAMTTTLRHNYMYQLIPKNHFDRYRIVPAQRYGIRGLGRHRYGLAGLGRVAHAAAETHRAVSQTTTNWLNLSIHC